MPKFFNLAPDEKITKITRRPLHRAVYVYLQEITASNSAPEILMDNWNPNQMSEYIQVILANCPEHFSDWEVPDAIETSVPCIAHLVASLSIFKDIANLPREQHLSQLKSTGGFSLINAGMPGPCLIYLHVLSAASEYDAISKMMILGDMINSLRKKGKPYGILASVVLPIAIDNWFTLLSSLPFKQQDMFSGKANSYHELKALCDISSIKENVTFIDQCIMNVWEQLHIDFDLNAMNELCHRNR